MTRGEIKYDTEFFRRSGRLQEALQIPGKRIIEISTLVSNITRIRSFHAFPRESP